MSAKNWTHGKQLQCIHWSYHSYYHASNYNTSIHFNNPLPQKFSNLTLNHISCTLQTKPNHRYGSLHRHGSWAMGKRMPGFIFQITLNRQWLPWLTRQHIAECQKCKKKQSIFSHSYVWITMLLSWTRTSLVHSIPDAGLTHMAKYTAWRNSLSSSEVTGILGVGRGYRPKLLSLP